MCAPYTRKVLHFKFDRALPIFFENQLKESEGLLIDMIDTTDFVKSDLHD
jgi:hypothetical protein